jgi:Tfp pilus tip-associated adhesin PilY1
MVTFTVSFGLDGTLNPANYNLFVDAPNRNFPAWPTVSADLPTTTDDLWHTAVNGRGDFLNAADPDELVQSLIAIVNNISKRTGSAASVSINGDELYETISADVRMFQTQYNTETWWGDLLGYKLDPNTGVVNSVPLWSANSKMGTVLGTDGSGHTSRDIFTSNGSGGKTFTWSNLTTLQQRHLIPYYATSRDGEDVLEYIRGSKEFEATSEFRGRIQPFGDFVHSQARFQDNVLYVGGNDGMLHAFAADDAHGGQELFAYIPSFVYPHLRELADPTYQHKYYVDGTPFTKKITNSTSSQTILVSGLGKGGKGIFALDITDPVNFDASKVMWEYPQPSTTIVTKNTITFDDKGATAYDEIGDPGNGFGGFAVGDYITVAGANCSGATTGSNDGTYEVMGATGSVLKIPTGSLISGCGNGKTVSIYKASSDRSMGYSFSRPIIVKTNDSEINNGTLLEGYVVIFGNGYDSANGTAVLYILNPMDGTVIRKIDTGVGPLNGLSQPKVIDVDNDLKADYVYAGDLLGNMWKFDLTAGRGNQSSFTNPDRCTVATQCAQDWQIAFCDEVNVNGDCNATNAVPKPLFSAGTHQAITAAPDVMYHSSQEGYMVIFGTGKFLGLPDIENRDTQSMYGIWDWAPDQYDQGYLGVRVDNVSGPTTISTLSHAPLRDASNDPVNTLLRQVVWAEGELSEDADNDHHLDVNEDLNNNGVRDVNEPDVDGDGRLDVDEDTDGDGVLDDYSYYRIASNYPGDWSKVISNTIDVNMDGTIDTTVSSTNEDMIPKVNVGWLFDFPGKLAAHDGVDNDADGSTDETGERALGERVVSDAIIREGRAILLSFGMSGATCNAGAYSFVNERDADTGGMLSSPVFDINGDGEVNADDMVYLYIDTDGDGDLEYVAGVPSDQSFEGRLYNPAILGESGADTNPEEIKYFSSSEGVIETMTEAAERRGVYYWQQVE